METCDWAKKSARLSRHLSFPPPSLPSPSSPFTTFSPIFFQPFPKVVYWEAGRGWESARPMLLENYLRLLSSPFAFYSSVSKQSALFRLPQPFSQSPSIYPVCPQHSAPSLVFLFPLHHLKRPFPYLSTRSFPPTRSPSIGPDDTTEPLNPPIPSTVLERPDFL